MMGGFRHPLRAPAVAGLAREPVSPRVSSSLRAGWHRLVRAVRWIEGCWVGDLLGILSLIFLLWAGLLMAGIFG